MSLTPQPTFCLQTRGLSRLRCIVFPEVTTGVLNPIDRCFGHGDWFCLLFQPSMVMINGPSNNGLSNNGLASRICRGGMRADSEGRAKKEISQAFGDRTEFSIHPMQFACYPEVKSSSTNMVQRCR